MIFVLGDSRTGTMSLHHWLLVQQIRSVHYFVKEAGLTEPLHLHRKANWPKLRHYLHNCGFEAFTDYPVRVFFEEIATEFPDADFILTVRRDIQIWRRSMFEFFGATIDIDFLESFYVGWNEAIRNLFRRRGLRLLELCIDGDSSENGRQLGVFLDVANPPPLPHLNASTIRSPEAVWFAKTEVMNRRANRLGLGFEAGTTGVCTQPPPRQA